LPGDRVDHMRGVADERQPLADKRARHRQTERIGAARTRPPHLAELEAEPLFQLGMEAIVGQRDDAFGLALFLGPYDRRALALQRQDRARPGREEMVLRGGAVVTVV